MKSLQEQLTAIGELDRLRTNLDRLEGRLDTLSHALGSLAGMHDEDAGRPPLSAARR